MRCTLGRLAQGFQGATTGTKGVCRSRLNMGEGQGLPLLQSLWRRSSKGPDSHRSRYRTIGELEYTFRWEILLWGPAAAPAPAVRYPARRQRDASCDRGVALTIGPQMLLRVPLTLGKGMGSIMEIG